MQQHPYDTSMKALFKEEFTEIVPHLLPGASLQAVLDIEVLRPTMRADRAYQILYREQKHIFHLEFQAGEDDEIAYRSLIYHAGLLRDHQLTVISMIIYLFKSHAIESPLREMSGKEELLTFHFKVLKLWTLDAREYVQKRIMSMYTLLPTMQYADAPILLQAIDEMAEYFKDNEAKLARRLLWLATFLKRTDTVSVSDKQKVEARMDIFEQLLEQNDFVLRQRALGEELGEARGEARGKTREAQQGLMLIIETRFPTLTEVAQTSLASVTQLERLHAILRQIVVAPDEATVRAILSTLSSAS